MGVEQMKNPMFVSKGGIGYGIDESQKVVDDNKGWVWLAAEMSPGGLALELFTSVPTASAPSWWQSGPTWMRCLQRSIGTRPQQTLRRRSAVPISSSAEPLDLVLIWGRK